MRNIDDLLREVISEAKSLKIPISDNINKEVVINKRAKQRFGCCKMIKKGIHKHFVIEISQRIVNCPNHIIKQILAHELIHTCDGCYNHGKLWKNYTSMMNDKYGYKINRTERGWLTWQRTMRRTASAGVSCRW